MGAPVDQVTVDGYDTTWGTNTLGEKFLIVDERMYVLSDFRKLGPFYFTKLLLPALFGASTPNNKSRVVNTSSAGSISSVSYFGSGLDFATFKDSPRRRKYSKHELYCQSKLVCSTIASVSSINKADFSTYKGNVVFTQELARQHGDKIVTTAVHPG